MGDTTKKKPKNISSSTIVDLKNELSRKRAEFEYQKAGASSSQVTQKKLREILKHGLDDIKPKKVEKNKAPSDDSSLQVPLASSDSEAFARSRAALERKAALYERLVRGEQDAVTSREDDDEEGYLVDFDRKSIHDRPCSSLTQARSSRDIEDWVEYVDNRGIKRRCMKSDLPELRDQDKRIRTDDQIAAISKRNELLSRDDLRELERQRWETRGLEETEFEDEQGKVEDGFCPSQKPVGPIHYSHLSSTETRPHGVGYFSFAPDEAERQEQMEALNKLHEQTADQRRKAANVKASREALKQARLGKILERKGQQPSLLELGKDINTTDDIVDEESPTTTAAIDETGITWPRQHQQREWDRGKNLPSSSSGSAWQRALDEKRNERISDFAPPLTYKNSSKR